MTLAHTRIRTRMAFAVCCSTVLPSGCGMAMRTELATSRSLNAAATTVGPVLRDYHREITAFLGNEESRVIDSFVANLQRDIDDQGTTDAHVACFIADLDRLGRDRLAEEDRYRTAMHEVGLLRSGAEGLLRSAEVNTGMWGALKRYVDAALDGVAPAQKTESGQPGR